MRVLITGGTGSLGSALVRHFVSRGADRVIVYSRDEVKQAALAASLQAENVRFFLGDVRDYRRVLDACWGVDTVVHTAALKRVDLGSYNPSELLKTNVLGTQNVLRAAMDAMVGQVLMISSDKAVHPINVYGASKQMAEFLTVRHNVYSFPRGTRCAVLRYGNVWGSRGSLVEQFWSQLDATGKVHVTNPSMTRFYITISQAVECVEGALSAMEGGEIFVPKLPAWTVQQVVAAFGGPPMEIIGPRFGGEKLHEQLLSDEEEGRVVDHGPLYVVRPSPHEWITDSPWDSKPCAGIHYYASNNVPQLDSALLLQAVYDTA